MAYWGPRALQFTVHAGDAGSDAGSQASGLGPSPSEAGDPLDGATSSAAGSEDRGEHELVADMRCEACRLQVAW